MPALLQAAEKGNRGATDHAVVVEEKATAEEHAAAGETGAPAGRAAGGTSGKKKELTEKQKRALSKLKPKR